jgi:hypothetical protein
MIDGLLGHQALIREIINGVAFILLLTLVIMISVFLWDTWAKEGPMPYYKWSHFPGVATACCLWWIFAAEAYRTCNVWLSYNLGKIEQHANFGQTLGVGIFSASSVSSTVGYLTAGVVLNLSLLRAIYIWTPPEWQGRVWLYASLGAIVFVTIPTFLI